MQLLRRYDLAGAWGANPQKALLGLHEVQSVVPTASQEYALAELAYVGGKKAELLRKEEALNLFGASAMHAYRYLFDPQFGMARNPYDPQFRHACNLYNSALEDALRIVHKHHSLRPGETYTCETESQPLDVAVELRAGGWHNEDIDHFEFVSDYRVQGLRNHHEAYGLGVPMIAVRKKHAAEDPVEQYYPPNLSFPVTAFLRMLPAEGDNPRGRKRAVLELYDPLVTTHVQVVNQTIPLQTDLSTPLAYFLNQPAFNDSRLSTFGFLYPDRAQARGLRGIYMLEPYQPGKIPVVMVHGLWSSPVTWTEMFNDLRGDPELREHYQFWFYLYPTGQPFWTSAAQMREDLAQLQQTLDPNAQQPALLQTVLVGHSMGGLVCKLQSVESGDAFWGIVTDKPLRALKAQPDVRDSLARTFFFQANPSVRRVITIGTPHGGSHFANDATRWLGRKLISLPSRMILGKQQLVRDNPDYFRQAELLSIQTSIDSLSPESPFLPVLYAAPAAPWVRYHNVIGREPPRRWYDKLGNEGDGVVSLASARLDGVDSEIIVPADHSTVHRHPRTILEARRILMEHLNDLRSMVHQQPSVRHAHQPDEAYYTP